MTLGEKRVRASFNPSGHNIVDELKAKSAELIDICERLKAEARSPEVTRVLALAQTHYEDAAMWAVKGATA